MFSHIFELTSQVDCIYLRSLPTQQGGHKLLDLGSGRVIIRSKVIPCEMTQTVINRVEEIATRQGYVTLKFLRGKIKSILMSITCLQEWGMTGGKCKI